MLKLAASLVACTVIASATSALAQSTQSARWTGFYAGLHGGHGWGKAYDEYDDSIKLKGTLVGGQIGYDWQIGSIVLGLAGDASWSSVDRNEISFDYEFHSKHRYLASTRGRIGYAIGDWMLYGTGGLAFTQTKHDYQDFAHPSWNYKIEKESLGYAIGSGVELQLGKNLTVNAELLHYKFTDEKIEVFGEEFKLNFDITSIRGGLNYRF